MMTSIEAFKIMEDAIRSLERATRASIQYTPGAATILNLRADAYAEIALLAQNFRSAEEKGK